MRSKKKRLFLSPRSAAKTSGRARLRRAAQSVQFTFAPENSFLLIDQILVCTGTCPWLCHGLSARLDCWRLRGLPAAARGRMSCTEMFITPEVGNFGCGHSNAHRGPPSPRCLHITHERIRYALPDCDSAVTRGHTVAQADALCWMNDSSAISTLRVASAARSRSVAAAQASCTAVRSTVPVPPAMRPQRQLTILSHPGPAKMAASTAAADTPIKDHNFSSRIMAAAATARRRFTGSPSAPIATDASSAATSSALLGLN